ncbi:MAG: class I SAM-dependent methyltransferase [Actinomycetota bacterium]
MADEIDPRRAMWRRGSYEIVGDWIRPASLSVLDLIEEVAGAPLGDRRLLDVATGTGAVAIEAARRGATVVGVDLTDELVEIAERRAAAAGVDVRFVLGDFDQLDEVLADERFDVITSAFGVIFAPDPASTLDRLVGRVIGGGLIGVTGWDPDGALVPPESMIELFPERPPMLDMSPWTTAIAELCAGRSVEVAATRASELMVAFPSVDDAADQLERWAGGWTQLLEMFDTLDVGGEARQRFRDHLAAFSVATSDGIEISLRHHTSVLRTVG